MGTANLRGLFTYSIPTKQLYKLHTGIYFNEKWALTYRNHEQTFELANVFDIDKVCGKFFSMFLEQIVYATFSFSNAGFAVEVVNVPAVTATPS